jgi:hypothetical protein
VANAPQELLWRGLGIKKSMDMLHRAGENAPTRGHSSMHKDIDGLTWQAYKENKESQEFLRRLYEPGKSIR